MKLRHLEIFYAVMTCGSLSRAAEALNISQPAASKALKSAEMRLGFTLFQRVRGKLLPTSEAITLFEKAQSIYQDLDNLRLLADNLARDPRAKITLGCLPSLGLSLVPELVTDFYQQNSNLVMTLTTEHTETLVKKLDLREIDLALTLQPVQQGGDPDHPDCRSTAGVHRPSLSSGGGGDRPDRPAALDLAGTALALCRHRHPSRLFHHPAKRPDLLYGHRVREARHGLQHH
ncbi:transcriptional activator protein LysR [Klebsiella pneumoniae]|uniref:Transcriptional activator protein LysR n=1 Tax=Klebsiella pneumoniae TaxID=573 RepID=A0A3S4IYX3_KLEPN|nr:transcriptional activator protein LysR [Klebsiella pneumoniae]